MLQAISDRYPKTLELEDGGKVTGSLMSSDDREALSNFLSHLTQHDLAYLQADITQPEIQGHWLDSIDRGDSVCLCAYDPSGLVGYASVQLAEHRKSPKGEIRVNISQGYRSRGLGRELTAEIFHIAKQLELDAVTARMMADQHGARAAFKRLGFEQREVLKDHVKDAAGTFHDLLVMTHTT